MKALRSLLLLSFIPFLNLAQTRDPGPLTNQRVIQLVQSGVSADELLRVIQIAPAVSFSLTPANADQLRRAGVSQETIKMMAARELGLVSPTGTVSVTPGVRQQVPSAASQPPVGPVRQMTNATVVQMVQAKISPDLIVLTISECEPHFLLDNGSTQYMLQIGVSEDILKAMAARESGRPSPGSVSAPPETSALLPTGISPIGGAPVIGSGTLQNAVGKPPSQGGPYGFQVGSVAAEGGAGFIFTSGLSGEHTNFSGDVSVGVHKHLNIFGEGGYSTIHQTPCNNYYCVEASENLTYFAGGLEIVGPTWSRFVPYARVGAGYGRGEGSVSLNGNGTEEVSGESVALAFGGGVRMYLTRHFGISAGVQVLDFVSGGGTVFMPTASVFAQSK
jgi:hypothetical protein